MLSLCICSFSAFAQKTLTDTVMGLHEHTNDINCAVYSLDGRRLITAGLDQTVHYYEATNWIELYSYSHDAEVTQVAISRDNAIIASASKDNKLKIYFLDSSKMLEFDHEGPITGIVIDFGMRFLYTSSSDGNIRPYDLKKGEFSKRKFPLGFPVTAISISNTNFLYAGLQNGEIKVLNNMGKEAKALKGHTGEITSLHFVVYKAEMKLVSASLDNSVKIWDAKTFKLLKTLTGHTWTINHVELSRDLKYVLSASNDGTARIWNATTGENIISVPSKGEATKCVSINEDNQYIVTVSVVREPKEYVVYIWDTGLKEEKPVPPQPKVMPKPAPTPKK